MTLAESCCMCTKHTLFMFCVCSVVFVLLGIMEILLIDLFFPDFCCCDKGEILYLLISNLSLVGYITFSLFSKPIWNKIFRQHNLNKPSWIFCITQGIVLTAFIFIWNQYFFSKVSGYSFLLSQCLFFLIYVLCSGFLQRPYFERHKKKIKN